MARSSKSRIFFSGQTILNQNSYNLKVKWNDGHPEIMELIFNEKLVPSNVLDEPNSKVLITLSSSTEYFEKEIGNIKDINLPEPEEYSYKFSNWTKFKLSIRKGGHGEDSNLILASQKNSIRLEVPRPEEDPEEDQKKTSPKGIMGVTSANIGDLIWKLDFDDEDGMPFVTINNRDSVIGADFAKFNSYFRSMVYPKIIEQILFYYMQVEGYEDSENDESQFSNLWIHKWAAKYSDEPPPPWTEDPDYQVTSREWASNVANEFNKEKKHFGLFVRSIEESRR
tara:strand:+ start:1911 stop:2756 length:846 start_codon:yes stop_codon:yes gene_type:complete